MRFSSRRDASRNTSTGCGAFGVTKAAMDSGTEEAAAQCDAGSTEMRAAVRASTRPWLSSSSAATSTVERSLRPASSASGRQKSRRSTVSEPPAGICSSTRSYGAGAGSWPASERRRPPRSSPCGATTRTSRTQATPLASSEAEVAGKATSEMEGTADDSGIRP